MRRENHYRLCKKSEIHLEDVKIIHNTFKKADSKYTVYILELKEEKFQMHLKPVDKLLTIVNW